MQNVLVIGGRKSGVYAALLAKKLGNRVFLTEISTRDEVLGLKNILDDYGIECEIGKHSFEKFKDFDLAVLSPGIPLNAPVVVFLREQGIPYIGEMEFAFQQSKNTKVVGITGTNGKSTTTALIGHLLGGLNVVTGGNLGTPYSALLLENENPDYAVLETSCFQLETIKDYKPYISVFLNVMENHLDRYPTMFEYVKAKKRIFENQLKDDFAILNFDDSIVRAFASEIKPEALFFSVTEHVTEGSYMDEKGEIFFERKGQVEKLFNRRIIPLIGLHNVQNVLASLTVAKILGIKNDEIFDKVRSFQGLHHRLEKVRIIDGVVYINDSKSTTPDSTIVALNSFDSAVVLIAGGSSKNNDFTQLAKHFKRKVKKLILIGETSEKIAKSAEKQGFTEYIFASSLDEAVKKARLYANRNDIVLLSPACASFDMFRDFEDRGDKFKEIVNSI